MSSTPHSPLGRLLTRHAEDTISEALSDTRVVLVVGARQSGKSTVVSQVARDDGDWRSLDNASTRSAAVTDPHTFVSSSVPLIIDEIQRVPELLLAIKETVDTDPRPGRFLLTGSAHVLAMRSVPDALPGRMETVELWPLSQGEIGGTSDTFVDAVFAAGPEVRHRSSVTRDEYIERLTRGGFPEAVARTGRRRERFFENYVSDLVNRDVTQVSAIERGPQMRRMIRLLAARSGSLIAPGTIAGEVGLARGTVETYLALLEQLFLIKRVPAWTRNLSGRAVRTPKLFFVDSGIAADQLGQDAAALRRVDGPLGGLLEGFVASEIARQLTWSSTRAEIFHYRTKDQVEVDIVLEDRRGRVVAIEVKSAATVRANDFRGIDHLAARIGGDLLTGIVLYTGAQTLSFGPKKLAIPISALWER